MPGVERARWLNIDVKVSSLTTVEKAHIVRHRRYSVCKIEQTFEPYVVSDEAEHNLLASPVEGTKASQTNLMLISRPDYHQFQCKLGIQTRPLSTTKWSLDKTLRSVPYNAIIHQKVNIEQIFTFGFVMFPSEKSKTSGLVPPAFTCTYAFSITSITCLRFQRQFISNSISNSFTIPSEIH